MAPDKFSVPGVAHTPTASVAVNQSDEEEEGAEGDGTSEHRFHQQSRPAAQQKHVDKQSAERERKKEIKWLSCALWMGELQFSVRERERDELTKRSPLINDVT